MKRVCVLALLLAAVILPPASSASWSAVLQEGWYVDLGPLTVYDYDPMGGYYPRATGWFSTPTGSYGPFLVTDGQYHSGDTRGVLVPSDAYGVQTSESLDLPVGFGMAIGEPIAYVGFAWETDYDAGQMRLELWRTRYGGQQELMWLQPTSGFQRGFAEVAQDTYFEGLYSFRVAVLPEPGSVLGLATGLGLLLGAARRRRA